MQPSPQDLVSVTAGSDIVSRVYLVGNENEVQVSLVLDQFSNKVSGAIQTTVQVSNDGQNWTSIGSISAGPGDAGGVQVAQFTVTAHFCRLVTASTPAGNTVSFATNVSFSSP